MADAITSRLESQPIKQSSTQTSEEFSNKGANDTDKIRLFKRAVGDLYGEKKTGEFKSKGPKLSGLQKMADWMNSDEVKSKGVGVTLVQGLEADKARKNVEKPTEEPVEELSEELTKETPPPAPVKPADEKPDEEPAILPEIVIPPALKTDFGVGIVSDPTRIEQEIGGLAQHDRSREKPAKNTGLGGFIKGLASPILTPRVFARNFVQNTLFKGSFDARSMGFSRSMMEIARTQHAGLDSSIPFEMPQEILDTAIEEGRKIRKADNVLKRFGWTLADTVSGLTGFYENSDMRYAEKWFKENGKELVDGAKKTSLSEQTELGERFALKGENKDVISDQVGETRFKLDEVIGDQPTRDALHIKIKELVASYAQDKINDEELLKQFNIYYHKEVLPHVSADKQKEITGTEKLTDSVELSSNILRIAREMKIEDKVAPDEFKSRYERYQDEKADDGEAMWNKLHFDIYLGKGKYEVARGEVRLLGLEKSLIHNMVERNYKIANDLIGSSAAEMLNDVGIYGLTYVVGGTGAMLTAGKSFFHVGGFALGSVVAGAREGFLFSKEGGKLVGLRGKAVNDFEQVSRETASGRRSKEDAKLRPMFEKAMVDQRKASELTDSISSLLQKDSLSEPEQKQLLQALAHAKARLTLTDLSTKKGKAWLDMVGEISVAQNFIGFSADNNNAEMTTLRAAIIQGGVKLAATNPELYGKLNDCQAVYEAQLRVGSFEDKMIVALARDTDITQDEARTKVADLFEDLGIDNKDRKSLEASSKTLAGLVRRKAATTAAFALAVSPIIGAEMQAAEHLLINPLIEGGTALDSLITNHGAEWSANWNLVKHGQVPLTYDNNHNLQSGLSPLQKDVLAFENWENPPPGAEHIETIDTVQVVLPGGVQHGSVQGHPDEDALVDMRTGEVLVHMDRSTLFYDDKGELMVRNDDTQAVEQASTTFAAFAKNGIQIIQDPNLNSTRPGGQEIVFQADSTTVQGIDLDGDGKTNVNVSIPANSRWIQDPLSGKYDLQTTNTDGSTTNVIEDATINSNGEISGGTYDTSTVHIDNGNLIATGSSSSLEAVSGKEVWGAAADYRVVHASGETFDPIRNETFATSNSDHPYGVRFTFPEHNAIQNPNTGVTDSPISMADGKVGLLLQIPHFGQNGEDVGVFVPAHLDSSLHKFVVDFDPADKTTMIDLPNGSKISMADLSQNFLNEGKLAEHISQNGGPGDLGSETWYEGRQFFNLANPDGDIAHQGRILGGYFDESSKLYGHDAPPGQVQGTFIAIHAVHGSSPVNLSEGGESLPPTPDHYEPVVSIDDITKPGTEQILGYKIEYDQSTNLLLNFFSGLRPVAIRENVEKSVRGEAGTPVTTVQSTMSTTPTSAPQSEPEKPKDETRKKLEKIATKIQDREKLFNLPVIKAEQLDGENIVEGHVFESAPIKYDTTTPDKEEEYEIYGQDGTGFIRAVLKNPYLTVSYFDEENQTLVPIKANQGIKLDVVEKDLSSKNIFLIGTDFYRIDIGAQAFSKVTKEEEERLKKLEWFKNI